MRSLAQAKLKRVQAVELLAGGCSYEEIARQVGFSHRGSAHRAVSQALAEREAKDVDNLRALECARLDALQAAHWSRAIEGDTQAAALVLKIVDQRSRLLGLKGPQDRTGRDDRTRSIFVSHEGNPGGATDSG